MHAHNSQTSGVGGSRGDPGNLPHKGEKQTSRQPPVQMGKGRPERSRHSLGLTRQRGKSCVGFGAPLTPRGPHEPALAAESLRDLWAPLMGAPQRPLLSPALGCSQDCPSGLPPRPKRLGSNPAGQADLDSRRCVPELCGGLWVDNRHVRPGWGETFRSRGLFASKTPGVASGKELASPETRPWGRKRHRLCSSHGGMSWSQRPQTQSPVPALCFLL